jgi:hypothetical protein
VEVVVVGVGIRSREAFLAQARGMEDTSMVIRRMLGMRPVRSILLSLMRYQAGGVRPVRPAVQGVVVARATTRLAVTTA